MSPIATSLPGCIIRSWRSEDESSLSRNANNRAVWLNLLDTFPHPYTPADARAWIDSSSRAQPEVNFSVEYHALAVGGVGLQLHSGVLSKTASFGYWVGEAFWKKGIATAVVNAFAPFAMSAFDLVRLEARVFSWNTASARVLAKCGFREEARLAKRIWKDEHILDEVVFAKTV